MIVDDSPVARTVLSRMIFPHKQFEVVALAADASEALDVLGEHKVDIIMLDVEMPGPSGLEALPDILEKGDGAQVLIVSSNCEDGAEAAVKALALGAADTLPKPGAGTFVGRFADTLIERLRKIGRAAREDLAQAEAEEQLAQKARLRPMAIERLSCLGIGASTGGLHALNEFFAALPPIVDVPILITQHLPPEFMPYFARQIQSASGRQTRVAETGFRVKKGEILIAPGDAHLSLRRQGNYVYAELVDARAVSGCMPSVDTMLTGMANVYGAHGMGIVLSGMGRDGLTGSKALIDSGGAVIVQDQHSCAVWGMPRAVADADLASAILPPADLAMVAAAVAQGVPWM
jgi:two-component system chemotaxis response regulator CheB